MQTVSFNVLLASILSAVVVLASPATSNLPVCFVGAGPAGLSVASRIENKGYKTVILEEQAAIGGKCHAYYEK